MLQCAHPGGQLEVMIRGARQQGIDVTTEVYPWTASSTRIESALYDTMPDGYDYSQLLWPATGERLTRDSFLKYRRTGSWLIRFGQDERIVSWLVAQPDVIIATDGIPFENGMAHPRGSGTFARVLGKYVREEGRLSLMSALKKMTLLPARRLQASAPQMEKKGRLQEGMDADITVFDPETIGERATFSKPAQYSKGIVHVFVNGVQVIKNNHPIENTYPGRPIRREVDFGGLRRAVCS